MVNLKEIEQIYNCNPTPCLILKTDSPTYTIAAANTAFYKATWTTSERIIDRPFFEVFPPNDSDDGRMTENIITTFTAVLRHKQAHHVERHQYALPGKADGQHISYWNIETYPLLNEAGEVQYIVQSSTDVTTLVEAEIQLKDNNERLQQHVSAHERIEAALQLSNERYKYVNLANNDVIYDWDIVGDKIEWSHAFHNFGYSPAENFTIVRWKELVHPDDRTALVEGLYALLHDAAQHTWVGEYRLKRKDASYADIEGNGYILRDEQGLAKRMIGVLRDVSARKMAEAELESLKDTFSDLFQLNPVPMWVFDFNSLMFLDVNEAAVEHYGYTKEEFLSMSIQQLRPPEDDDFFWDALRNKIKPGYSHSIIVRHRKKSGEIMTVNVRGNSIRYGTKEARIAVALDITEKVKYEKALVDSERRFKTLIQESSDIIVILDSEGIYKYLSPTIERLVGLKPEQLVNKNALDAIHELDRDYLRKQLQLINEQRCISLEPYRLIDQENRVHWLETIMTDMRDDEAIDGIVCNVRVVTERVEQQLKIKEHLERFNAVSKATSDTIWDYNYVTGKVLWNHGIKAVFGYKELEVNFAWWYERVHPADVERVTGVINDHVEHLSPRWKSEYRFRCADGTYKYVLDRGFLIFDDVTGEVVRMIGALQDISDRVAHTKAIEANNRRLKEIAWSQAHLVRGPLTSILGLVPLLKDPALDEATRESMIAYLDRSAAQLDETIKAIISKSHDTLKNTTS